MKLLAVTPLGRNRDKSRLWIETRRLEALGFPPGTPFTVEARSKEIILRPSILALPCADIPKPYTLLRLSRGLLDRNLDRARLQMACRG